jgi:hypothetical protein
MLRDGLVMPSVSNVAGYEQLRILFNVIVLGLGTEPQ